ncbi:hypothetical protein Ahy_A08g038003 [Arachis hypogaea]|uniref:SWIM-type domain-containing protein n=1 Tax=Arachis hypogaea TaxID=3818 RepID=A0A445BSK3_ARAHY|nr:hypothetical protein Ahy_A08g038003 [Arachis hypogaea]
MAQKIGISLDQVKVVHVILQRQPRNGLLGGMPCRHAVAVLAKMGLKAEDFMHKWLTMKAIRATYSHCIKPINNE